jgi:hypothetical protein
MSLDKAIAAGKERRKPYRRSKRFDRSCRPGGSCPWCYRNRKGRREALVKARAVELEAEAS